MYLSEKGTHPSVIAVQAIKPLVVSLILTARFIFFAMC